MVPFGQQPNHPLLPNQQPDARSLLLLQQQQQQQQQPLPQPLPHLLPQQPQQLQPQPQSHQLSGIQGPHGVLQSGGFAVNPSSGAVMEIPSVQDTLQQPPPPVSGKRFGSIFPQRRDLKPPSGTVLLSQQAQQRVFPFPPPPPSPAPGGGKLVLPAAAGAVEDVLPPSRDMQPLQELVGGNWLFVVFLPYFVATALQDTHLRIGLIIGTVGSGVVFMAGLLVYALNMRKVFPHILEMLMPIIFVVQLGVSYHSKAYEEEIIRTYPFITHSALAGVCLVSVIVCYPVGYQTAQELVHKMYMTNSAVHRVGLYTTAILTASLVTSCLLYLAPLCKGYDDRHFNALNIIFRLVYPCLATFLALLFVRFFPDAYLPNFSVVHGLNRKPPNRVPIYLVDPRDRTPPAILDASMFQSTIDAVAKAREAAREAACWPPGGGPLYPSSTAPPPPLTPRYNLGSYRPSGAAGMVPYPSPGYGVDVEDDGVYGSGGSGGGVVGGVPGVIPGGTGGLHSAYMYYAVGPPAKPPLAVYAVYGDYDALPPQNAGGPTAGLTPYNNKTVGGYGVGTRHRHHHNNMHKQQLQHQQRYVYGSTGVGRGALHDYSRQFASGGDAGPYGINLPLRGLAAAGTGTVDIDNAPGLLPSPPLGQQPDAIVMPMAPPPMAPSGGYYSPTDVFGPPGGGSGGGGLEASYYREGLPQVSAVSATQYRLGSQQQQQRRLGPGQTWSTGGRAPLAAEAEAAGVTNWAGSVVVMPPPPPPLPLMQPPLAVGADAHGSSAGYGLEAEQLPYDVQQSYQPYGGMPVPLGGIGLGDQRQQVSYQDDTYGLAAETEVADGPLPPPPRATIRVGENQPYRSRSPLGIQRNSNSRLAAVAAPLGDRRDEGFGLDAELGG